MKKSFLAIAIFLFSMLAVSACTEEEIAPNNNNEGGSSKPTGF